MRTALILLFLLALASVPGSLLPQRPLNAATTRKYIDSHGGWGRLLDRLGMFDVFGSPWFAAVYLLLFLSLIGCLVPRIRVHARNALSRPLPAPRNLGRLASSDRFATSVDADTYATQARRALGRRWRVERRTDGASITLSAEKGYSRETGNLLFHVALLLSLVLIVIGRLYNYEMTYLVEQGNGFCNGSFPDSSRLGRLAQQGYVKPPPFCVNLDKFDAEYLDNGQPSKFDAQLSYTDDIRSTEKHSANVSVNNPLRMQGDRVYLVGHGFAPELRVRFPDGETRDLIADFAPTNEATLLSEGAFEATRASGKGEIGVEGFFAPTPVDTGGGIIGSASPKVDDPVLGIFVYTGTLHPTGRPHDSTSLDKTALTKIGAKNLRIGESYTPEGSKVTVTFTGYKPWVTLQVSHDPAQGWLLGAAVVGVVGLVASLRVRRRRIWLRITPDAGAGTKGLTVVEVGGIARSDRGDSAEEFGELLTRLRADVPIEPAPPVVVRPGGADTAPARDSASMAVVVPGEKRN